MPETIIVTPFEVLKGLFISQYKLGWFGVNLVFSGFNDYLRKHCGISDPVKWTNEHLIDKGLARISGRRTTERSTGRVLSKSVILILTEAGETHFGIHPPRPSATASNTGSPDKKVVKLVKATQSMKESGLV